MALFDSFRKIFGGKEGGGEDRASLEKKVKASPNDPQARQKLALLLFKQREVTEGLSELAKAAELYEKDGFESRAVAVLRQMLKYDVDNVEVVQRLISMLARKGLFGDARGEFDKAISRGSLTDDQKLDFCASVSESMPDFVTPRLVAADILIARNSLFEAVSSLEKGIEPAVAAGSVEPLSERVAALAKAGGGSMEHLEACVFLWLRLGKGAEAQSLLPKARELAAGAADPSVPEAVEAVASALSEGRTTGSAMSFLEAAAALGASVGSPEKPAEPAASVAEPPPAPSAPSGSYAEAAALFDAEEAEEEAGIVKDALGKLQARVDETIGESDLETRYNLGIAYKEMGLMDEAVGEFRIALRSPELKVGAATMIAEIHSSRGELDAAVAELEALVEGGGLSESDLRDVRYFTGMLLEREGRDVDALAIYEEILAEAPGYRDLKARIEKLRG